MCPDTTDTAPNSPMARALHNTMPYTRPQRTFGSVTRKKVIQPPAPRVMAASSSSLPSCCMSGISSRATYGKVTNMVASMIPGSANTMERSCSCSHGAEPAVQAEQQHEHHARDHRRDRQRQIDERDEHALAAELELGDRPGCRQSEHGVDRHHHQRGGEGQADGGSGVGIGEAVQIGRAPLGRAPWRTPSRAARAAPRPGKPSDTLMNSQRTMACIQVCCPGRAASSASAPGGSAAAISAPPARGAGGPRPAAG